MRCGFCHSYIPEGLTEQGSCPQCGRSVAQQSPASAGPGATAEPSAATPPALPRAEAREPAFPPLTSGDAPMPPPLPGGEAASGKAFAPFFTLQTNLAFGPAASPEMLRQPTLGSLSFGPDGFAIVSNDGKQWEKIRYHDLASVRPHDDSVLLVVRDVESRLTLYHPWLPGWLAGPRRRRAAIVAELLSRVRSGLTSYEISLYRRRLK